MSGFLENNKELLIGVVLGTVFGAAVMSGVVLRINEDWYDLSTKSAASMFSACQQDIQNIKNHYKSGQQRTQSSETWSNGDAQQVVIRP